MKHCIACNTQYGDNIETCPTDGTILYSTEDQPAPDALIGMLLDKKYRIEKRLGEGGMGVVYQATHIHIESTVAIKVLHKDLVSNPQSVERFRREARAAGRIRHPNAISVIDFGVAENNLVYIVMEYLEGMTLAQRIRKTGRVMPEETVAIMRDVCAALDAAHNKGVIHRDLKPDNIILQRVDGKDRVKVLDFGIAQLKSLSGVSMELTQQGTVIGTPFYMSPEQCRGEELDKRSDVYSLGIILFEMLTGRLPFQAETAMAMIVKHMTEPPPRLREIQPDIPPLFEVVTLRALAKGKAERQGSAAELGSELDNALAKSKGRPGPAPVVEDLYKTTIRGETRIVGGPAGSETEVIGSQVTSPIHAEGEAGARTEVISASPSSGLDPGTGSYSPTVVTSAGPGTARGGPASGNYETTVMPGGSTALPAGPSRDYTKRLEKQQRTSRMSLYISVGAVVLVGVALGVGWWTMNQKQPSSSTTTPDTTTIPVAPSGPVIPETMLKIPEGTFLMGRNDTKNEDEKPAHSVTVASFHIGRYEVTNKEYQEFVKASSYPPPTVSQEERQIYKDALKPTIKDEAMREPPAGWTGTEFPPGEDNLPVTNVSWNDAAAYCKWLSTKTEVSYRLPTEEEWEYTAKGTDQRIFPWGNNFDPSYTNSLERIQTAFGSSVHPMNVLQFKDAASPFGTAGQAGNVAEWTASMAKIYPGSKYPPIVGDYKVVRGGSFMNEKFELSTTSRNWLKAERKIPWLGFRLAMDQPPTTASK